MTDVVERAKALPGVAELPSHWSPYWTYCVAIQELVAELETTRAVVRAVQDELTNITDDHVYDRLAAAVGLRGAQVGTEF